jgi:hypothetical protein
MKNKSIYKKLSKPTMEELLREGYLMKGTTFAAKQVEGTRPPQGSTVQSHTTEKPSLRV